NAPLGKKSLPRGGCVFVSELQAVEASRGTAAVYDAGVSGRAIYAYVGNDPLNVVDPLGLDRAQSAGNVNLTMCDACGGGFTPGQQYAQVVPPMANPGPAGLTAGGALGTPSGNTNLPGMFTLGPSMLGV